MSESSGTVSDSGSSTQGNAGDNAVSQSAPANPPTQSNPTPPPANSGSGNTTPQWATDLNTAITALPETIARSVKEAIGNPAPRTSNAPANPANEGGSTSSGNADKGTDSEKGGSGDSRASGSSVGRSESVPGKRKNLADWWFNG